MKSLGMYMTKALESTWSFLGGGVLGPMISDVRDYYIDNFRCPTLLNMIFPFPSLFLCPKSVKITLYFRFPP